MKVELNGYFEETLEARIVKELLQYTSTIDNEKVIIGDEGVVTTDDLAVRISKLFKQNDIAEYQEKAIRTFSYKDNHTTNLLHCAMGIITEGGEILDVFKKTIFYGKELDEVNIKEELGDVMWYIACMCLIGKYDFVKILETNIAKLRARYPDKFDMDKALNRDLVKERLILEAGASEGLLNVGTAGLEPKYTFEETEIPMGGGSINLVKAIPVIPIGKVEDIDEFVKNFKENGVESDNKSNIGNGTHEGSPSSDQIDEKKEGNIS